MILKASQRGNARELITHLLNGHNNEHVTVHDVRGFIGETVQEALIEAYAISKGTRCRQFLFSLSINPPDFADVDIGVFEGAIKEIEEKLGLLDQPRIIVFHEKKGRRHCHVVWSRIRPDTRTALNMAFFKYKLNAISKGLFLKHNWPLPRGFKDKADTSKSNFDLKEWQQSLRIKERPEYLKQLLHGCWQRSDNKTSFAAALQDHGLYLAKGGPRRVGDRAATRQKLRRGFVAVDVEGEVYSLSRWLKIKTKELRAKLGEPDYLPSVDQAHGFLKSRYTDKLKAAVERRTYDVEIQKEPIEAAIKEMVERQRYERDQLITKQETRYIAETKFRKSKFKAGVAGIMERVSGRHQQIKAENTEHLKACVKRDQAEMHSLITQHLSESKQLHSDLKALDERFYDDMRRLKQTVAKAINTAELPIAMQVEQKALENDISIRDTLIDIENKIATLGSDIISLEEQLGSGNLMPEALKAQIRQIIERAKETLQIKAKIKDQEGVKAKQEAEHEEQVFYQKQSQLYALMQRREQIKQQEKQRQHNGQFKQIVLGMTASIHGIPKYEINLTPPDNYEAKVTHIRKAVKTMTKSQIEAHIAQPKSEQKPVMNSVQVTEGAMIAKEALIRSGKYKTSKSKPSLKSAFTAQNQASLSNITINLKPDI